MSQRTHEIERMIEWLDANDILDYALWQRDPKRINVYLKGGFKCSGSHKHVHTWLSGAVDVMHHYEYTRKVRT